MKWFLSILAFIVILALVLQMDVGYQVILAGLGFYFIPSYVAIKHPHASAIFALNLLLGWTFLGWVAALVWALAKPQRVTT